MPLPSSLRKVVTSGFLVSLSLSLTPSVSFAANEEAGKPATPSFATQAETGKEPAPSFTDTKDKAKFAQPTDGEKRYIVRYDKEVNAEAESTELKQKGVEIKDTMTDAIEASVIIATPQEIEAVKKSDEVASVELDYPVSIAASTNIWGIDRVDQRNGRDGQYSFDEGAGVNVYVVDTGLNPSHTDFSGRVPQAWSGVYDGRGWADCSGHGTHVAGTIAGTTYGVAKKANIIPVRALDCNGQAWASTIMAGIDWSVAHHQAGQPAVMNLSIGGFTGASFEQTIQNAHNDGISVVSASGNAGQDACWTAPAKVASAITVAATDIWDNQVSWANYGSCVDVQAPGIDIRSAWINAPTGYNTLSGTSMAAPHVSGAAAIMLSRHRHLTPADVHYWIVADATVGVINNVRGSTPNRMLFIPPAPAPPVASTITSMEVADYRTTTTVNLRSGPGTNHGIIGVANPDTVVNGQGRRSDVWFEVKLGGTVGWMHSDYLRKIEPAPAPAPAPEPAPAPAPAPITSSVPTITGTTKVGSTLTANPGSWGPEGVILTYQWKVDGQSIIGATASTYAIPDEYLGKSLSVTVTGSKTDTASKSETSVNTALVAKGSLTTAAAVVSGTVKVGNTLTVNHSPWGPAPVAMSYQWHRDGVAISGATAKTYTLTASDAGKKLAARVIGRKTGYTAVYRQSPSTVVVALGDLKGEFPKISGTTTVGNTLTATAGAWTPGGVTLAYQWYRDGVAISGATAKTFVLTEADRNKKIKVRVLGKKAGYVTRAYYSYSTATIG